ncbi:branched-chain amino acid ABC transporter permease [Natrialba sp. INN-245]|uniref:branched-chain amino acid ABC transporter permease n=1 Tax=Natrialba sp. INN-245 TaxID=2690967 RepID=UPI0013139FC1|nr:branched-chain amino acid ABC transporter permease [Natrialba sp. INN-245]MWV41316.1 branched-chain amino acid ABC transporter permease [Natrialba sp. INN-245]
MSRFPLVEDRDGQTVVRIPLTRGLGLTPLQTVFAFLGLVGLFALPFLAGLVGLSWERLFRGILFGLAAVGLNLLLRHTELVSFGHAAFFGGGAYGVAVLAAHYNVSEGLLLLLRAVIVGTTLAVVIGYFVAGYVDIYFALLTLAFNQVLFATVFRSGFFNYNDGLQVRIGGDRPTLFFLEWTTLGYDLVLYYTTIVLMLVMLLAMWKLINSPFGRALDAIGQDRTRARFIGIPVEKYVWLSFTISGLYGAFAGGVYALLRLHVQPEPTLYVFVSGEILFMAILGGFTTLVGPLIGGIILVYLLEAARFWVEYYHALTGLVLLAIVFFMPKGIVGSLPDFNAWVAGRVREPGRLQEDVHSATAAVREGVDRATTTVRIIVFGVK